MLVSHLVPDLSKVEAVAIRTIGNSGARCTMTAARRAARLEDPKAE